jgi:hypothetical protein
VRDFIRSAPVESTAWVKSICSTDRGKPNHPRVVACAGALGQLAVRGGRLLELLELLLFVEGAHLHEVVSVFFQEECRSIGDESIRQLVQGRASGLHLIVPRIARIPCEGTGVLVGNCAQWRESAWITELLLIHNEFQVRESLSNFEPPILFLHLCWASSIMCHLAVILAFALRST